MRFSTQLAIVFTLFGLVACGTIPVNERESMRQTINDNGDNTIALLTSQRPELQGKLDASAGHFAGRVSAVKIPVLGGGYGAGVLYDKDQSTRTYMNISRFDLGAGLGAGAFRVLILLENREVLEKFRSGKWASAVGAESAAGETGASAIAPSEKGLSVYLLPETGAAIVATARLIRISVNQDLTDTGLAEVTIPNTGFERKDRQGDDAPRKWERALPFLAQNVIDKGYDLPLPYGFGLTFAHVNQDMILDNLKVGINGKNKEPFEFVAFEDASSESNSFQLKLDAWLFPFMNVFGMLGHIEGQAPMDVILDGNDMLDHLEIDCSSPGPPNPLCGLLEDEDYTLEIEANYTGTTYGVGTVLAGGWHNWFVTLPFSFTYADMDGKDTDGWAITVTPRGGYVFNVGNAGNIAAYGGGNYLYTDLTISGTETPPGEGLEIDYTIDQRNADEWNLLLGGSWNINKRWSISAEYNGFIGSREALIASIGFRF